MPSKKKRPMATRARERAPEPYGKPRNAPPAYFLSLTVENVRCFGPQQTLDLSDGEGRPAPWTVLLGDNGTGKTTLLQCLVAMEPRGAENGEQPGLAPRLWPTENRPFPDLSREPDLEGAIQTTMALGPELAASSRSSDYVRGRFAVEFGRGYGFEDEYPTSFGTLKCYAYGASRRMRTTSVSGYDDEDACATLFEDDADLINAEEWLLRADYSANVPSSITAKLRSQRDSVIETLVGLLPDVESVRITRPSEERRFPTVQFHTHYGWVTLDALSLGYRTLIAWMVDLARRLFDRYPDSPNPLAEPAIVLVDEIDLHLHPSWQRNLMGYLSERFPNAQFIATAHSPLVVQAAEDANIAVLRREGDHVVIDNNPEAVRGWRVDQILTSDLFGLESSRPPRYEEALKRREKLLSKSRLTKKDREELTRLEAEIEAWPVGETKEDREAMDIIRRAAARLKQGE